MRRLRDLSCVFFLGIVVLIPVSAGAQPTTNVRRLYPGPALAAKDVAILKAERKILSLNGGHVPMDRDLELISGPHALSVDQTLRGKESQQYLRFEAKSGHTYEVRFAGERTSIIDTSSSEDVMQPYTWVDMGGYFVTGPDGELHLINGDVYWPAMTEKYVTAIRLAGKKKIDISLRVVTPGFLKEKLGMERSTALWLWGLPHAPVVDADGKLLPNQVVDLYNDKGPPFPLGRLFVLEGNDILVLYPADPAGDDDFLVVDETGLAVKMLGLSSVEIDKLTGTAREIAMALNKEQVTHIDGGSWSGSWIGSWIAFTQAKGGVLTGEFLCHNKKGTMTIAVPAAQVSQTPP